MHYNMIDRCIDGPRNVLHFQDSSVRTRRAGEVRRRAARTAAHRLPDMRELSPVGGVREGRHSRSGEKNTSWAELIRMEPHGRIMPLQTASGPPRRSRHARRRKTSNPSSPCRTSATWRATSHAAAATSCLGVSMPPAVLRAIRWVYPDCMGVSIRSTAMIRRPLGKY